jgi:dihydroneopterin aldolase
MDIVFIENYTVQAKHGYYKEEHAKRQRFITSIHAYMDVKKAGETDALKDTLNYEKLRECISDVLSEPPHDLVESLAEAMAARILRYEVSKVEVEIKKPDVWGDCVVGVKIVRIK